MLVIKNDLKEKVQLTARVANGHHRLIATPKPSKTEDDRLEEWYDETNDDLNHWQAGDLK